VLDVATIVDDALSYLGHVGMDLYLFDPSLAAGDQLVHVIASPTRRDPLAPLHAPPATTAAPGDYFGALHVADRRWVAYCVPTVRYLGTVRPWGAVAGLTIGLLATVLVTVYLILLAQEATRRESLVAKRTSQLLQSEQRFRQAINDVFQQALGCQTSDEVAKQALAVAERLTESAFGFVGELNPAGRFDTIALSDPGWDACRMPRSDATLKLQDMEVRSIWKAVIESGQTIVVNDPASWPQRVGTPEGHPPLHCFLGVPLKRGDETFGMMCLGNKPSGYDADDQHAVQTLSVSLVAALMRKRAEEALRHAHDELEIRVKERTAELARSNAELQQFAYAASHDLQEPLRMIASYVGLLAKRYRGRLDQDADEFIEFAVDGAKRMQELIEDLLAYSRVGTRTKAFKPTDCNRVVDEVVQNLRVLITEQAAVVTHDELPVVTADHTQLAQLIQNLVGNAIKFRAEEPPCVHVGAERRDDQWLFSVEDNGIGIDPKYNDRVFAIFQRLHTRKEYPGTGIGLAICRRIVGRHGGRIWYESKPGNGTIFHFTLSEQGDRQ
jgi:signal transduction histidine kinase